MSLAEVKFNEWESRRVSLQHELSALSNDELVDAFRSKLMLTAEHLFETATIMRELEEVRGIDMQQEAAGWTFVLRKIAYGQMLPELVVYFGARAALLRRVSAFAIPDQRKLIESDGLEFAEGSDCRIVDPRTAEQRQIDQLFAADHIRQLHEQRQWIASQSAPRKTRKFKPSVTKASDVSEDEMSVRVTVGVTPEWYAAIEEMAKANGWSRWYAATRFLIALGKK